jgi:hypothetical protein
MMKKIDPSKYGLRKNNKIYRNKAGVIVIVKNRKSRIIMKDGYKLLETAEKIKEVDSNTKIEFLTTAPICSKTKVFLKEKGIITR